MKKLYYLVTLLVAFVSSDMMGQESCFNPASRRERVKTRIEAKHMSKSHNVVDIKSISTKALDEYTDVQDDVRYRYVFTYNVDNQRASETIYKTEKDGDVWGEEVLCDVGLYSYEYDLDNRLKVKRVTYENAEYFSSYFIMVTYNNDGTTDYDKYTKGYLNEGDYVLDERWSYYQNGVLASHSTDCDDEYSQVTWKYSTKGLPVERITKDSRLTYSGSVNDVEITRYCGDEIYGYVKYSYDSATGRLLEAYSYGSSFDSYLDESETYDDEIKVSYENSKTTYEYDALGRMVSATDYYKEGGEWVVGDKETYTYANNEVYSVNNPWRVVFGMDGPWSHYKYESKYYEEENVDIVFNRDDAGKLLSVDYQIGSSEGGYVYDDEGNVVDLNGDGVITEDDMMASSNATVTVTVDDKGQITKMKTYEHVYTEENGVVYDDYVYEVEDVYAWTDGVVSNQQSSAKEQGKMWTGEDYYTFDYTHADNIDFSYSENGVALVVDCSDRPVVNVEISEKDGRYRYTAYNSDYSYCIKRDVQTADVSFVRPNILKDYNGFTADKTIIVSQAGRVVCCGYEEYEYDSNYKLGMEEAVSWNIEVEADYYEPYYLNVGEDQYFTLEKDGNLTVCYNMFDLPKFVLSGDRLVKEYIYYAPVYESSGGTVSGLSGNVVAKSVSVPAGQAYTLVEYLYDEKGRHSGKNIVDVDESGETTEEISVEYVYDVSGIKEVLAKASSGIEINGMVLGAEQGMTFDVYSVSGVKLAGGVSEYVAPNAGVYVVTINGRSVKVLVK